MSIENPQKINEQAEAVDKNKMVEEGLLLAKEARKFKYEDNMEIPEALLSRPPELSETLTEHVIAKFPAESFKPKNIPGTAIHGTSIRAIRPLWLGEGKQRTWYGKDTPKNIGR